MAHAPQDDKWAAEKVIEVPAKKVDNWLLPTMPGVFSPQIDRYFEGPGPGAPVWPSHR